MTTRIVRLSAFALGIFVAAPALANVSPLCGDEKHGDKAKNENKEKNENKDKKDEKKPANPA
jgi:hypothetical protein